MTQNRGQTPTKKPETDKPNLAYRKSAGRGKRFPLRLIQ